MVAFDLLGLFVLFRLKFIDIRATLQKRLCWNDEFSRRILPLSLLVNNDTEIVEK